MSERAKKDDKLPARWYCFVVPAVLPFVVGVLVLQLFAPEDPRKLIEAIPKETKGNLVQVGDRLAYGAAVVFQFATSIAVLCMFWSYLRKLSRDQRHSAYRLLGIAFLVAVGVIALIRLADSAAYQLTFRLNRELFLHVGGLPGSFAREGFLFDQSRIFYSALLPFVSGVSVVAVGAALMAAMTSSFKAAGDRWEQLAKNRFRCLQICFQASSLVLVTSAVALLLFLKLPAQFMIDPEAAKALSHFALGLTTFWGLVMTLTLFAVFCVPYAALKAECASRHQESGNDQAFDEWFGGQHDLNVKRHVKNVATMLAPVLVGPVGSLVQSMLGG